ncbi:UNVERIFIED_CONTAM: hypothetical protein Scaly_2455300 [Sesamum calycinum]|uniref:Uncharacterized protein n=1 Tax=Sesamum calycinum TaxID=2727403 RepID=A0AAW2LQY7_9LAMI
MLSGPLPSPLTLFPTQTTRPLPVSAVRPPHHPLQSGEIRSHGCPLDDDHHLIRRKSNLNPKIIPSATRQEDIPAKFNQSAPVNIPLWPKELRGRYKNDNLGRFDEAEDDGEVEGEEEIVPPHVIVARSHVTFSVFEGAGRTLKGRDLRRVRNAVFQKQVSLIEMIK